MRTTKSTLGKQVTDRPTAAKAKPKANAKASSASSRTGTDTADGNDESLFIRKARSKQDLDRFGDRLRRSPDDIKEAWTNVQNLKTDPSREKLFDLIMNVKKGDYSNCYFELSNSLYRENGSSMIIVFVSSPTDQSDLPLGFPICT